MKDIALGIFIPFVGTMLGSAMVFIMREKINNKVQKFLLGFASGVMVAASIWSLILTAIEMTENQGRIAWIPATVGFLSGMFFLLLVNNFIKKIEIKNESSTKKKNIIMMILAITLHNIPEGMAVGVAFAGTLTQNSGITMVGAFALAIGIAIQNFPEGAIISMPLKCEGVSKIKAFIYGTLSGIVEPIGAVLTIILTNQVINILPYFLSFAAGTMIYVVIDELIPEAQEGKYSNISAIGFAIGFAVMMSLDVALG